MTKISSIQVTGLAGRQETVAIDLHPDVNVIFGLNGTGKTSLLRLMYSAVTNRPAVIKRTAFDSCRVKFTSPQERRVVTRTSTLTGQASSMLEDDEILLFVEEPPSRTPIWKSRPSNDQRYPCAFLSTSRIQAPDLRSARYYEPDASEQDDESLNERFDRDIQLLWRRYSNRTLSEVRQIQQAGLAGILQTLFSDDEPVDHPALDAKTAYQRANDFLARQGVKHTASPRQFRQRYERDPRLESVVGQIDAVETRIEKAEEPRRRLRMLISNFLTGPKEVSFDDREILILARNGRLPLGALSSGEKHLIRIMISVIDAGPVPIIIDEPELSMHIDWQRELLSSLRLINPEAQLIVATHSPDIMANIPDSKIFSL